MELQTRTSLVFNADSIFERLYPTSNSCLIILTTIENFSSIFNIWVLTWKISVWCFELEENEPKSVKSETQETNLFDRHEAKITVYLFVNNSSPMPGMQKNFLKFPTVEKELWRSRKNKKCLFWILRKQLKFQVQFGNWWVKMKVA